MISSSGQYDETKWKVKGIVTANHTEAVSVARGLFAGVAGMFGGPIDAMNKKMDDVVNKLKTKMQQQIGQGERIVGFNMQFAEFGRSESNTFISGSAVGTLLSPKTMYGGGTRRRIKHNTV